MTLTDFAIRVGLALLLGSLIGAEREWRHKLRLTWNAPWDLEVSGTWRHISEVTSDRGVETAADATLKAMDYFDLAGNWGVRENVTLRFGVNNLFDKDPPLASQSNCPAGPCSGNTYPQTYDSMGRYLFIGARMDF